MKKYEKKNRAYFVGAFICILIANASAVILQFFKGDVLDNAVSGKVQATVIYALLLIGFILLEILFYFCYGRFNAKFVVGCTKYLKHDIFDSVMRRSYVDYKERPQGEYIAKYTNEADLIQRRRFTMIPVFWEIFSKIVFVSIGLFFLDWRIAIVTITLLTTPLYVPKLIEKRLQRVQAEYLKAIEENLAKVNDWFSGFEIIKNFSIERKIITRFKNVNDTSMEKLLQDMQLGVVAQLITTLISYLSYFIVLVCATWLVLRGDFTAGMFFIAIGMIDQLSYPLISLAGIIRQLVAIKPTCVSMEQFLDVPAETQTESVLKTFQKDICFRDVTFAYDGQKPILLKFNFIIEKGNRYLIQGPSGCGKTTTVNLLLRYYNADSGEIEVDGESISNVGSTYDLMTVVRQEAVLFNDTLRNNLTMYQDVPDGNLIKILERLGLGKFANKEALDSIVVESGTNLSGGEKKRVCLARALLRDTDILILDEPLANLDDETAELIEDLLLSIKNKTMLVVSHQFNETKKSGFNNVLDFARTT